MICECTLPVICECTLLADSELSGAHLQYSELQPIVHCERLILCLWPGADVVGCVTLSVMPIEELQFFGSALQVFGWPTPGSLT